MNGAELMDQMVRMTNGWWRPSPGSIYPLLEQLESEKLVAKNADGRYQLTAEARGGPEWMRGRARPFPGANAARSPEDATRELESYVRFLEDVADRERAKISELRGRLQEVARRLDRLSGATPGRRDAG